MIFRKITTLFTVALAVTQIAFVSCERIAQGSSSQEDDRLRLENMRKEILALSQSVTCDDSKEWKFIAMGNKACGGPQEYVLYSTKIDTSDFKEKVEEYTAETKNMNKKWGIASDCMFILPPGGVKCENGKAVPLPYYNPKAIIGTWKLTESLADPGDGSGKYTPVTGPDKFITFDGNGKVTGEAAPNITGYRILDTNKIEFTTVQNTTMTFRYKITGNQLELNPPCIEACGSKFVRM